MKDAIIAADSAPCIGSDVLFVQDVNEVLRVRGIALYEMADRLAAHFDEDVARIEGMLFAMSSNLGPLVDTPQGQVSVSTLIAIWLGKEDYPSHLPIIH
ncbi:MAG: hypothetical protein ACSHW2_08235 [Parasphingopyxis sp.]